MVHRRRMAPFSNLNNLTDQITSLGSSLLIFAEFSSFQELVSLVSQDSVKVCASVQLMTNVCARVQSMTNTCASVQQTTNVCECVFSFLGQFSDRRHTKKQFHFFSAVLLLPPELYTHVQQYLNTFQHLNRLFP